VQNESSIVLWNSKKVAEIFNLESKKPNVLRDQEKQFFDILENKI
jgi:hypothetical protein